MYAVILAGGGGTRLWPLSSPERPKPFLPLLGERTLLQLTRDRLAGLVATEDIFVVTDQRYGALARAQLPDAAVIEEPLGRNTAAAVALATLSIDRPDEDAMLVLPADHLIPEVERFRSVLGAARSLAAGGLDIARPLITLGIQPAGPATTYGYIVPASAGGEPTAGIPAHRVERFVEKPERAQAEALLAGQPPASWNAGIFCWQRSAIRDAFERHAPDLLEGVRGALRAGGGLDPERYATLRSTSIDYAVMEPAAAAGQVAVILMTVGWSDLGSWTALLEALGAPVDVSGRVVPAGEAVQLGPDDLLVSRGDGRLWLTDGPAALPPASGPRAHLSQAGSARDLVDALIERVSWP
ncbi:MAG TPA: mannose-1-phosphate guanylyltransferase [Candidatus Limnocylindrales bacterium]|nr:mannose-1-phosphate guanylyltransferase [Candidatus Limnocylindrales bacterium]